MSSAHKGQAVESLHLPQELSYTCHNSGECCTVFETIPADEQFLTSFAAAGEEQQERLGGSIACCTQPGLAGDPPKLQRHAHGSCVFLGEDHLCAIHSILGEDAKPQVCRDFPYRYVETPDGIYVGLSFACPSVRSNLGKPLSEQDTQLQEHYRRARSRLDAPRAVALNRRIELSWSEYLDLERAFLEVLEQSTHSLRIRMIACCVLVNFVDTYQLQLENAPVAGPGIRLPEGELAKLLGALRAGGFAELYRVAAKPRRISPRVRRMFMGMFTGFANTLHRKGGRVRTVAGVLAQYVRHAAGLGGVALKPLTARVSHSDLDRAALPEAGPAAAMLERYVRHCIFRKDLVLMGNVARRIRLLALNLALVPWYATAHAQQHGHDRPDEEDYSQAISHVERLYGFHSRFYRFFEENPAFEDIVEAFLLKPNYPFLILGMREPG